jgi:hypothetical protein
MDSQKEKTRELPPDGQITKRMAWVTKPVGVQEK